jgi:hypothetical protein
VKQFVVPTAIAVLALALRLPGLGEVMTVDEKSWMLRSATFYDEILQGNWGGTFETTHPGVTAMWLIGGGVTLQEKRLGTDVNVLELGHFRQSAVFPITAAISVLLGLLTWLVQRAHSQGTALFAGLLAATDPYLMGMSQIAHLDTLMALLMLASVVSGFVYLRERALRYLLGAGVLLGLALGVKFVLALWVLPILALRLLGERRQGRFDGMGFVRRFSLVAGVATLTLYLIWPALWVKDDIGRSFTRDVASVVTEEHVALGEGEGAIMPATFYARTWLGRSTPYVQLLFVGAAWGVLRAIRRRRFSTLDLWLFCYAVGFFVLVTLAAKKADRYLMPTYLATLVLGGFAAADLWRLLSARTKLVRPFPGVALGVLVLLLIITPLRWAPYAIAYNNPFFPNIRPLSQQGWGEGLETAAAWLNEQPFADRLSVASWYPDVTRTYFKGRTFSLSSREDRRVGYVITYRNMGGRAADTNASVVLKEFEQQEPALTVSIRGVPYVWVFKVAPRPPR